MNYEDKKQARIDYYKEQAEKASKQSDDVYNHAKKLADFIPFGQPILVGHHSEKRDRNFRAKISNKFEKAFELSDKAEYYEKKAKSAENNNAISSDDDQAVDKLKKKLELLLTTRESMKQANKEFKKHKNPELLAPEHKKAWEHDQTFDFLRGKDYIYAPYNFSNMSGQIKQVKDRIEKLEARKGLETKEEIINDIKIVSNIEDNRVQIFFPGIPSEEVRKELKSRGFKWSRFNMAWQRHLNQYALDIAKQIVSNIAA